MYLKLRVFDHVHCVLTKHKIKLTSKEICKYMKVLVLQISIDIQSSKKVNVAKEIHIF